MMIDMVCPQRVLYRLSLFMILTTGLVGWGTGRPFSSAFAATSAQEYPTKVLLALAAVPLGSAQINFDQQHFPLLAQEPGTSLCPPPVLARMTEHRISAGETLDSIAAQYGLLPATLLGLNPQLQNGRLPVGQTIQIPPYNGIVVTVAPGQTWEEVARAYNSRADVLFEVNGCSSTVPNQVFLPGVNWFPGVGATPGRASGNEAPRHPLRGYPLPERAEIAVGYGWQPHPSRDELVFNAGVTLRAMPATPVLAVGSGVVAFAGKHEAYGNLVVINHAQGLQTRYGNLASVAVTVGQSVQQGTVLGQLASESASEASSSNASQGPFLLFEVRLNSDMGWVAQDPQSYIPSLGLR